MLMIFLAYLFISISDIVCNKYVCTLNHTVKLEADAVQFFETPDFPRPLTDDEVDQCYINFTKNIVSTEHVCIFFKQRFLF